MEPLIDLIRGFDPQDPNFRPTEIFNEGWLLKALLNELSLLDGVDHPLAFSLDADWYSEALLPTAFRARTRGDTRAESRTNADGVIGHLSVGTKRKADLLLDPRATQFIVIEAKMSSPLSAGTTNAPFFDQAARNVACMAEVLKRAVRHPSDVEKLAFVVLAPQTAIQAGLFSELVSSASVEEKVRRRVAQYDGELDEWLQISFTPVLEAIQLLVLSWEEAISNLTSDNSQRVSRLQRFYESCLRFN